MIDLASTKALTCLTDVSCLHLMAAIVARAVEDASLMWKKPKPPSAAYKLIGKRNKEGLTAVDPVELELAKGKVKRYQEDVLRAAEHERQAKAALRFLLSRGGGMDNLAAYIGFDPESFRRALLYGRDDQFKPGAFCGHARCYERAHRWGLHPERWG